MELLEQHFDTAFAAPDGIKKLRELILTLAMQGKLVPQDPSDPPASQLLKDIEVEKNRLWRDGEIKAPKPLLEIKAAEIPYPLPQGWEWARIRAICYDLGQKTPDNRFTYIDVGSIDSKAGVVGHVQVLEPHEAPSRARKIVRRGTVIYSTIRPYLLNIAIIEDEYDNEAIASTAFAILHPFTGISNRFVYYYLRSPAFIKYVEGTMKGVAYPAINDGDFFQGVFPLPPISEQRRIVAKIDQLMARCDELERLRAESEQKRRSAHTASLKQLLDAQAADSIADAWQCIYQHFGDLYTTKENVRELRKAILQLAVMGKLVPQEPNDPPASQLLKEIEAEKKRLAKEGKIKAPKSLPEIKTTEMPFVLPPSWEWCRVWDVSQLITSGSRDWAAYYSDSGAIFVTMGNLSRGSYQLRLDTIRYVAPPVTGEGSRTKLEENDLLISITGDVGNLGLIPPNFGDAYINQHTCLLRLMPICRNRYFPELMRSPLAKVQFDAPQRGIKNSFRLGDVGEMIIPLPPLPEQQRIVAKIDKLMSLCDTLEQQIDAATSKQSELLDVLMASPT